MGPETHEESGVISNMDHHAPGRRGMDLHGNRRSSMRPPGLVYHVRFGRRRDGGRSQISPGDKR